MTRTDPARSPGPLGGVMDQDQKAIAEYLSAMAEQDGLQSAATRMAQEREAFAGQMRAQQAAPAAQMPLAAQMAQAWQRAFAGGSGFVMTEDGRIATIPGFTPQQIQMKQLAEMVQQGRATFDQFREQAYGQPAPGTAPSLTWDEALV